MRLALIPPIPNLYMANTGTQMVLAHLLKYQKYTKFYKRRSAAGDFLILDNGAHEGSPLPIDALLEQAGKIRADEVVIPDEPHDAQATKDSFDRTLQWLQTRFGHALWRASGQPRLMMVPQAEAKQSGFDQFLDVANYMHAEIHCQSKVPPEHFTIGLPLMYDLCFEGGLLELLDRITWLVDQSGVEIHLLGWSRKLQTPINVSKVFPNVRSVDTAKPFIYARHNELLTRTNHPPYPGRPDDYFIHELSNEEREIAATNVTAFEQSLGIVPRLPELASRQPLPKANRKHNGNHSPRLPDASRGEQRTTT